MPIIAKKPESSFAPCPEGLHQAVCVDVVDLGIVAGQYGDKHKVEIRWQVDAEDDRGRRHEVRKWYTLSLHEKSNLRKDLECWRGRKFTDAELAGFDLENLIKANCQLQVIHNVADEGKVYSNVQAIVPHNPKLPKIVAVEYVRQKDRATSNGQPFDDVTDETEPPF